MTKLENLVSEIELAVNEKLTDVEAKEVMDIYSEYDNLDFEEFRLFSNIKECVFWVNDEDSYMESLLGYMVEKLMENNMEYKFGLEDLTDSRYKLLSTGRVIANLDC